MPDVWLVCWLVSRSVYYNILKRHGSYNSMLPPEHFYYVHIGIRGRERDLCLYLYLDPSVCVSSFCPPPACTTCTSSFVFKFLLHIYLLCHNLLPGGVTALGLVGGGALLPVRGLVLGLVGSGARLEK